MKTVSELLLVYPDNFPSYYSALKPFYLELYELIPSEIQLNIIVNNEQAREELKNKVNRPFLPIVIKGFDEIWLRDFMGFFVNGEVMKPEFKPDYLSKINTIEKLKKINQYSNKAIEALNLKMNDLDIVWDGGNLVTNGKIGFITDKILDDNKEYSTAEILSRIEYALAIKPVLVPTSKFDTLGHIDGYMSFLEEDKICISVYPDLPFLRSELKYLDKLREIAKKENLDIIDVKDNPVEERCIVGKESIESVKGCYVNFLKLNNTIILPEFDLQSNSKIDNNNINRNVFENIGYNVKSIDCTALSKLGGVLHCISWEK